MVLIQWATLEILAVSTRGAQTRDFKLSWSLIIDFSTFAIALRVMRPLAKKFILGILILLTSKSTFAQLQITESTVAQDLAQKLVGNGVTITNATLTPVGGVIPTGFFTNLGQTTIGLDSGIVITNGRARTGAGGFGILI